MFMGKGELQEMCVSLDMEGEEIAVIGPNYCPHHIFGQTIPAATLMLSPADAALL